jgi:serine/threonine protein kinase
MLPTAVKIIVADLFDSSNDKDATSDEVALANRELQTMKKLPPHKNLVELLSSDVLHPNPNLTSILKVYGDAVNLEYIENAKYMAEYLSFVSQSKFRPTIIIEMELCGPTLRQWLVLDDTYKKFKNGMTEEFALFQFKIAQCIIAGLTHLHDNSHIHRDLKPENIYFSANNFQTPIVKIGDLGFTREMSGNSTETRTEAKGTRIYRAREVNSGKYGKQADLFALGLILWEIFEIVPFKKFSQLEARLEKLTIDREKLNIGNAWVPNLDEIIFNLTFRDKTERTKKIGDFDLKFVSKISDDSDVDMGNELC